MVLGAGHVLRVPMVRDGREEMMTVVVERVVSGWGGTECYLTTGAGGMWIPQTLLCAAIADAEISVAPTVTLADTNPSLPY
jgi:hypothetical protein